MKNKLFKLLKVSLPVAIGIYLTWYFISNSSETEKDYFLKSLSEANYLWILAALVIAFLSHLSRAYR
jgi:glycosyltransferase 2 family protein